MRTISRTSLEEQSADLGKEGCSNCGKFLSSSLSPSARKQHLTRCLKTKSATTRAEERCSTCGKHLPQNCRSRRKHINRCEKKNSSTLTCTASLSDESCLLRLLSAFGRNAKPDILFEKGRNPQARWSENGRQSTLTLLSAGIDSRLAKLISRLDRTQRALQKLNSIIEFIPEPEGHQSYLLKEEARCQTFSEESERTEWAIEALRFVCFVFPREPMWDTRYIHITKQLQSLLLNVLQECKSKEIPLPVKYEAIEALLAASRAVPVARRRLLLGIAIEVMDDNSPSYLFAEIAYQHSVISRLLGDYCTSEEHIHQFCRRFGPADCTIPQFYRNLQRNPENRRFYARCGYLHISHLENLMQKEIYNAAIEELDDWQPLKNRSLIEALVAGKKSITISKMCRSQGRLEYACRELEACNLDQKICGDSSFASFEEESEGDFPSLGSSHQGKQ